jgi:hypothetical protein
MSLLSDLNPADVVLKIGQSIINRVWPDPAQQADAQLKLLQANQSGELDTLRLQMSAIIAEAQSADPYTSRARPSFLYVMYLMILLAVPVSLCSVWFPDGAARFTTGIAAFLDAIPDSLWQLFGVGYLGYTGVRTWEKNKGLTK